jgi:hypothetical protein
MGRAWCYPLVRARRMSRAGRAERRVRTRGFIHQRCVRLAETLPAMRHDPSRLENALRYLVATMPLCGYCHKPKHEKQLRFI